MKLSQFLLQVSIFILIAFAATPSEADGIALKKWMESAKEVAIVRESSVQGSLEEINVSQEVKEFKQTRQITIAKCADDNELAAFSGNANDYRDCSIDKRLSSSTNYLPWFEDKATFMLLDHSKWGNWYFTAPLSGCDVWIATGAGYFADPLTIHVNANEFEIDRVKNLEYKEYLAKMALDIFNDKYRQTYRFVQRISYDYALIDLPQKGAIDEYWNTFESTGIPYNLYSIGRGAGLGFFYGTYDTKYFGFQGRWSFVLKELSSGNIRFKMDCSAKINKPFCCLGC